MHSFAQCQRFLRATRAHQLIAQVPEVYFNQCFKSALSRAFSRVKR
jgi:hypothetical protein